jgi:hypothetical protein
MNSDLIGDDTLARVRVLAGIPLQSVSGEDFLVDLDYQA